MTGELVWVTKTAQSRSLSHSDGWEKLEILSQAQRVSRRKKARRSIQTPSVKVKTLPEDDLVAFYGTCELSTILETC